MERIIFHVFWSVARIISSQRKIFALNWFYFHFIPLKKGCMDETEFLKSFFVSFRFMSQSGRLQAESIAVFLAICAIGLDKKVLCQKYWQTHFQTKLKPVAIVFLSSSEQYPGFMPSFSITKHCHFSKTPNCSLIL